MAQTSISRPTAAEIYSAAVRTGEDELKRSSTGLALSGLAAGLGMGLTGLGSAAILAEIGDGLAHHLLTTLLYPLGFIVVIVGRAQLFTENTLFPVVLVLDRRRHLGNTLRLWAVVFTANVLGALLFAALMIKAGAVPPEVATALTSLGSNTVQGGFIHLFWAGVAGGWIIALMAWLVTRQPIHHRPDCTDLPNDLRGGGRGSGALHRRQYRGAFRCPGRAGVARCVFKLVAGRHDGKYGWRSDHR